MLHFLHILAFCPFFQNGTGVAPGYAAGIAAGESAGMSAGVAVGSVPNMGISV